VAVERRQRAKGVVYRSYWRDEGGRQRSRTFSRKADADAWDAKVKLAKRQGDVAQLDGGREPLRKFVVRWRKLYADTQLAPNTLRHYVQLLDTYILPRLGDARLQSLTPERLQTFAATLTEDGVGDETVRKTLAVLSGILEHSVRWGRLTRNPVRYVKKPPTRRQRRIRPLPPSDIEKIRGAMLAEKHYRDATLVSVLAYAGLRPGEALGLRWDDIGTQVIHVERAIVDGQEAPTKTRRLRTVNLLNPLKKDLAEWRKLSAPESDGIVFPTSAGTYWRDTDFRNWRRRRFNPAVKVAGLPKTTRPYDLRHSFASLLLAARTNQIEAAVQMGHDPHTLLTTYAHVIDELRGKKAVNTESEITKARRAAAHTLPGEQSRTPQRQQICSKRRDLQGVS
jgi:integrase